jgi:hypothetical protein
MDYSNDRKLPVRRFSKKDFNILEDTFLFVSGANCFKILPEMQETWARILALTPGSRLLLHPFNPNWTNKYPEMRFRESLMRTMERHGVEFNRLIVSNEKLPTRADVVALLAIGDVYLDTFPYSGSISLTDPLETGVPTLVCEDKSLRSRQGAALLRDLGVEDLITDSAETYISKAVELAKNPGLRLEIRQIISKAMRAKPRFLNPERYGRNLGLLLETVVREGLDAWTPQEAEAPAILEEKQATDAVSVFPNVGATLEVALSAFKAGRLSEAEDLCRELLGQDQNSARAWALMGRMAASDGDRVAARDFAARACDLEPGNADFAQELRKLRKS